MTTRYHEIPRQLFNALAAGRGGPEAISELAAAQHSKHLVLLRGVLAAARDAGGAQAHSASLGWEVLTEVERYDPQIAARVTRYPAVGAWAMRTLLGSDSAHKGPEAIPSRMAEVAAAAAVQSGLDTEVPVLPAAGVLSLPTLGVALVGADSATVRSHAGRAEIRWAGGRLTIPPEAQRDASSWLGLRGCDAGQLDAVIDDLDPFRMPAVEGLAPRLTAEEAGRWEATLKRGWQVLAIGHPNLAAEAAAAVSVIVPLSRSGYRQRSSSSPETFGAVAMSEPADPETCAAALAHELQHMKLGAVLGIIQLVLPDDGRRYYAPWRPDPRPVAGLLQGAYAFLGVTEFWRRQRQLAAGATQLRADSEFALWRSGTVRVIETLLSSKQLTAAGLDFVQRMSEAASEWADESISAQAQATALRESRAHLAQWETANGPVPA